MEKPWGRVAVVALIDPSVLERYPSAILDSIRIASPETAARLANSFRLFSFKSDPDDPLVRQRIEDYRETLRVRTDSDEDIP